MNAVTMFNKSKGTPKTHQESNVDTEKFAEVTRTFCELLETHHRYSGVELLKRAHPLLAELYYLALLLPDVDPTDLDLAGTIDSKGAHQLLDALSDQLGEADRYRTVMEPHDLASSKVYFGSLADDLVDIYRDLERGLFHWPDADSETRREVIWQWRSSFRSHWSNHVSGALSALSWCLIDADLDLE